MRGIIFVSPFTKTMLGCTVSFALAADPLSLTGTYLVVADGTPLSSFEVTPGTRWVQIQTNRYGTWKIYRGLEPWTARQALSGMPYTSGYQLSDDLVHNTALCVFEDFDVTDFNGLVPKIEIIAAGGAMPARCPCADMDWMGHDMTAEHHPDCPTRRSAARVVDDRELFIPAGALDKAVKHLADSMRKRLDQITYDPNLKVTRETGVLRGNVVYGRYTRAIPPIEIKYRFPE